MTISQPQETILRLLRIESLPRGVIANHCNMSIMGCESSLRTMLQKGIVRRKKNPVGPDPWLWEAKCLID